MRLGATPGQGTALGLRPLPEDMVRPNEERLRILADAVPQIIWANDAAGAANYFNRRWHEYTGLDPAASVGLGWQAVVHPDDEVASICKWQGALAAGSVFDCEYRLRGADGEYRWFIGRNVPLRDGQGTITGWFGSATDIHALKLAETARALSEQRLRAVISNLPGGAAFIVDRELRYLIAEGEALETAGLTPGDLVGKTIFEALPAEVCAAFEPKYRGALAGEAFTTEIEARGRAYLLRGVPLYDDRGAVSAVLVVAYDISERRAAEQALALSQERLRLVVDGALEHAIISMDLARHVTSWNAGAERTLGFLREEITHRSVDVIFTPEDRASGAPQREAETALRSGRAADERWHMRKDGSLIWGSGVMLPLLDRPGGKPTGFIKILQDETAKREAQLELERSRQELVRALHEAERARADAEAAMRAKDDFLAALSHELRTPLNPVLLLASEAADEPSLPEHLRESFSTIRNNVQLEARLIDDLLDITRISRGKLLLERCETDAHAVLRETAAIVRAEAEEKAIQLTLHLGARDTTVNADPIRLQQVFWNVMKNAVKFTPADGRVEVHTLDSAAADRVLIAVSDTGIGMTATELGRVFDAFAQGEHAEQRGGHQFGGLGLGLAISRMLVELHGGSIRALSGGRGNGSTFEIDLPLAIAQRAATATADGPEPRNESATSERLKRERILLVEDHDATRVALAKLLRRRQLIVETASSIAEALDVAAQSPITLLLSDVGLPDGSGYDLMREMKDRYGIRGVALTGYGTQEDVARSRRSGFSMHLTKPISAQALDRALASLASP